MASSPPLEADSQSKVSSPAVWMGIRGWVSGDVAGGQLIFRPDATGYGSAAYRESVAELGEWDEWTFEVDVSLHQADGYLILSLP